MATYKSFSDTGLEYTRTVDEAEVQKQRTAASIDRMYSIASYVFALGLIAVGALCVISLINNAPKLAIGCEIIVFICLILLLFLIGRAKKRISEQRRQSERYPYKSVSKKEIDKVFDIIADEEKKRERLVRFAMGNQSAQRSAYTQREESSTDRAAPAAVSSGTEESKPSEDSKPKKAEEDTPAEDSGMIHIFPDEEEEMVSVLDDEIDTREPVVDSEEETAKERRKAEADTKPDGGAAEDEGTSEEAPRKKRPRPADGSRPPQSGKRPPQGSKGKRRPPADGSSRGPRDPRDPRAPQSQQGAKKRRPPAYDPYYGGGYYYDEYGRPISRRPPAYDPYYGGGYYYDEYGQPVRRREPEGAVYYDEYGRPIRRRPPQGYDPRREDAMKRKRPASPGADPSGRRTETGKAGQRPPSAPAKQSSAAGPKVAPESKRTAAPVAMPSLKSDFDEERVAVMIDYEAEQDNAYDAERGNVALRAERGSANRTRKTPVPPKSVAGDESGYSPRDMEAVPIVIPDDDYYSRYDDDEMPAAPAARPQGAPGRPQPKNVPDYYYDADDSSPMDEDAGVVVVPEFSDYDEDEYSDRYAHGRYRNSSSTEGEREQAYQPPVKQNQQAYTVDEEEEAYSYEDEGVVVLPHDEGYESYLEKVKQEEEKKRIEERKLARKKSGKIALTIRKVRRKKIHRKSRRYKRFRASVIPLAKYLGSYDG